MKSSKKFGKSIVAIVLSIMLLVSVVVPLTALGSANNGGGATGTKLGQYRYYSVKSGDTFQSIASANGITVSDIMSYNGLDASSVLYKGQILKLPITTKNQSTGLTTSTITIKSKDANVKDLVSAIAANAGYTVIYKGADETISIELERVTPLRAIDYITRMVGLSFLKDGNTILVASASELNSTFVDSLVLSKFSFRYITYTELTEQASALGLSDMKIVSQSNNGRDVWISAYPKEMAKLHELCEILDVEANVMSGSAASVANFTPIQMNYIDPNEFSTLLSNLGLHPGIVMSAHPTTLYVYASGQQLAEIMKIKAIVDTSDASANTNTGTDNNGSSNTSSSTIVSGNTTIVKLDLVNISKTDAEAIVGLTNTTGTVTTYGHQRMLKSIWLMGPSADVNAVKTAIQNYDSSVVSAASTIHKYEASNCTVAELMNRISNLNLEGVTFYEYDHPELTSTVICYCDDITWENEVLDALVAADTVDTGSKVWIPIASRTSGDAANNTMYLQNTIALMNELYSDLFGSVSFRYETFLITEPETDPITGEQTGGSYKTVVYAYTTSDAATRMSNCMTAIDEI